MRVAQVTVTWPPGTDNDPYLPALVASSCKAMLSAKACFGGSVRASPWSLTRASFVRASLSFRYGASSLWMMSASGAPAQASRASRLWVCDNASNLARKLSLKAGRSGALATVWSAIACTEASVFFTRWLSSASIISLWRAARTRSVISRAMSLPASRWPSGSHTGE